MGWRDLKALLCRFRFKVRFLRGLRAGGRGTRSYGLREGRFLCVTLLRYVFF